MLERTACACGDKHLKEAVVGANHSLGLCGDTMSDWSSKNPYMSEITENYILNGEGSRKETRHIVFASGRLRSGLQSR